MPDPIVGLTTTPTEEEGRKLARGLVETRLAACAQVTSPITAIYRWRGELYEDPEWQIWIKTATDKRDAIVDWLKENHSGEVPELVFLPVDGGLPAYLDWMLEETR